MAAPRRLVRIALELDEHEAQEIQTLIEEFNKLLAPMKLSRSDLIREAIREKVVRMKAQLAQLKQT
ncbi:MAG: ribbon-helix-helix protein, CopG family [Polyangia bacterium]